MMDLKGFKPQLPLLPYDLSSVAPGLRSQSALPELKRLNIDGVGLA
ncbi:MAG: hypothetical protein JSU92_12570 [Deltaproteobacteria bacterium]|nr:MAG: hypothetical protein JSU92_12570 [Deltaproteobacteria bacterium]